MAGWSTLIDAFLAGILQYWPLPWKPSVSVFFLSPLKFKLSETQKRFQKAEFIFFLTTIVQLYQAKFSFSCDPVSERLKKWSMPYVHNLQSSYVTRD